VQVAVGRRRARASCERRDAVARRTQRGGPSPRRSKRPPRTIHLKGRRHARAHVRGAVAATCTPGADRGRGLVESVARRPLQTSAPRASRSSRIKPICRENATRARRFIEAVDRSPKASRSAKRPVAGELAFVFTGAAAGYEGMGREPRPSRFRSSSRSSASARGDHRSGDALDVRAAVRSDRSIKLWGSSFLCQPARARHAATCSG